MIVVDVGNTSIHFYWIEKGSILKVKQIPTAKAGTKSILKLISSQNQGKIIVCSVVPCITKIFESLKKKISDINIVGKDLKVPIKCFYNKKAIGTDRLVAAFAATKIYKNTRIVIDFGTAITFDILSKKGDYLGGFILPGIGSTLKVLSGCALLPNNIKLLKEKKLIPRNTNESISKGMEEGFSSMVNSLVKKYKCLLNLSSQERIIITGGDAKFILPNLKFKYAYEPYLVANGLYFMASQPIC